jgi:hypothetical protein
MKKFHNLLFLILLLTVVSACKKDKPVSPQNKVIGKWTGNKDINNYYTNNVLTLSATTDLKGEYVFNLNPDGTGNVVVSGVSIYTFNYTINNSKINYTNYVYHNPDGSTGTLDPFFEDITTLSDTNLVTVETEESTDNKGNINKTTFTVYFTRTN